MNKLIVGCGYLGLRVARRWLAARHTVAAVTRDAQRAEKLQREGLHAIVGDVCRFRLPGGTLVEKKGTGTVSGNAVWPFMPSPTETVPVPFFSTVLYAVGYDRRSGQSRWDVYVNGLRNVLDALPAPPERIIFISSTGVYGEDAGGWVDEDSPCNPTRESGRALLAAEQLLQNHALGSRAIILRLAGIYGPGRMRSANLRDEETGTDTAPSYLNLIHVDDAASVVLAAESRAVPPRTYVVSDGHPVERREFLACLARVSGDSGADSQAAQNQGRLEKSPYEQGRLEKSSYEQGRLEKSPYDAGSRGASSGLGKRVNNGRMMRELGVRLAYPTYREGLAAKEEGGRMK